MIGRVISPCPSPTAELKNCRFKWPLIFRRLWNWLLKCKYSDHANFSNSAFSAPMSSSFTMFYPVLNPVEWHQKSIQILSKSLIWMLSTKNRGKIVLRSLWVESCQWRSFLMNFRWFKGPIIFPTHPSESKHKNELGLLLYFISKKNRKKSVNNLLCSHLDV